MQHVEQRHLADHRAKQIGTLRHHRAHQQPAIRPALNRQMIFVRIFFGDQMFGRGNHVVKHVLFLVEHPGAVPVFAELRAAAQIRHSINSAMLHPQISGAAELRRQADVEPAIGREQRRIFAVLSSMPFLCTTNIGTRVPSFEWNHSCSTS